MNRHVGASFAMSLAIWMAAAVALRVEDRRSSPPVPAKGVSLTGVEADRDKPTTAPAAPARTRSAPAVATASESRPTSIPTDPKPSKTIQVSRRSDAPRPDVGRATSAARRTIDRSGFLIARRGETLRDVSRRALGAEESVDELWRANRDQCDGPDAPLKEGTLLRAP